MRRYLIRNNRVRKVQTVCGRTLASLKSGGHGEMWLTEEQWSSDHVQKRIAQGRVALVRTEPPTSTEAEVVVKAAPVEVVEIEVVVETAPVEVEVIPEEVPAPPPVVVDSPVEEEVEEPVEEVVEEEASVVEETVEAAPEPVVVDEFPIGTWTFDTLKPRSYRSNQKLAKQHGLKSSGAEDEIIERLLAHQEDSDA